MAQVVLDFACDDAGFLLQGVWWWSSANGPSFQRVRDWHLLGQLLHLYVSNCLSAHLPDPPDDV